MKSIPRARTITLLVSTDVKEAGLFYSVLIYLCSHGNDPCSTWRTNLLKCSQSDWVKILVTMPKAVGQNKPGCQNVKVNIKVHDVYPGLV